MVQLANIIKAQAIKAVKEPMANSSGTLWNHCNSSAATAISSIAKVVEKSNHKKHAIGVLHLENMAPILFAYGEEVSFSSTERIVDILQAELGEGSVVVRAGIEDFIFSCPFQNKEKYSALLDKAFNTFRAYGSNMPGAPMYFSFHAGSAVFEKGDSLETALNEAFIALYECKHREGFGHCIYDEVPQKMQEYQNQMHMATYFQNAIIENKLRLAYQPLIDGKTGKVKSYECLLRIMTDEGKIITAGPFIPIAENLGFIDQIDTLVLKLVVKELQLNPDVKLGLNVSNLSIDNKKWLALAKKLLKDTDISSRLIVEVTETGMQRDLKKIARFVDEMQGLGCQVAIDDFGTGYTSFTQLKVLNADIIKIDGIFIKDIVDNPDNQLFVKTLLGFAKGFGLKTVAEFVETGEIAKMLMDLGVDYMQGHYFSEAMNHRPWIKEDKVQ